MEAGVPCSLVNDYQQVFDDPHVRARDVLAEVEHPRMGRQRTVRNPVRLDEEGPDIARPAPLLGEHSAEILSALGLDAQRIEALTTSGIVGAPGDEPADAAAVPAQ
jgi:formyl-CoA transferase